MTSTMLPRQVSDLFVIRSGKFADMVEYWACRYARVLREDGWVLLGSGLYQLSYKNYHPVAEAATPLLNKEGSF